LNFLGFGVLKVLEVDEAKKPEVHMTSAAAFVEGGIQESCDDACSICLEDFCESDPSTVIICHICSICLLFNLHLHMEFL
jgi:hypothetical protein